MNPRGSPADVTALGFRPQSNENSTGTKANSEFDPIAIGIRSDFDRNRPNFDSRALRVGGTGESSVRLDRG